jgi:hypothetical protein
MRGQTSKEICRWAIGRRRVACGALLLAGTLPAFADELFEDPGFESGVAGFYAQEASDSVAVSTDAPLAGVQSLRVAINSYGNNVWWRRSFADGRASHLQVSARLRSDAASSSTLKFCAAYYVGGQLAENCAEVSGAVGDKGVVSVGVDIDPQVRLDDVRMHLSQVGSSPMRFTLDQAAATLSVVEQPPDPDPGPGPGPGPGTPGSCTVSPDSQYEPHTYVPPAAHPFVSLASFTQVNQSSRAFTRFKQRTDQAITNGESDPYFATYAVILYRITGSVSYLDAAIARVDAFVTQARNDALAGKKPHLADDRFYFLGEYLEPLALTYDAGFTRLSPAQRSQWAELAEQALTNLWLHNPSPQVWYGVAFPDEVAWSICDPGNNYFYTFMQSTMLWALAAQSSQWLSFLQLQKFPPLIDYFAQFPGGGTREGTGYGTALKNLFLN